MNIVSFEYFMYNVLSSTLLFTFILHILISYLAMMYVISIKYYSITHTHTIVFVFFYTCVYIKFYNENNNNNMEHVSCKEFSIGLI